MNHIQMMLEMKYQKKDIYSCKKDKPREKQKIIDELRLI